MVQKYLNSKEAAAALGVTVDDIKRMLDSRQLYGYRDGADWKFKVEDIEKKRQELGSISPGDGGDEVVLSEVELGDASSGASGTVIGMGKEKGAVDSDLRLADSDLTLAGGSDAKRADELDLTLDEDISLDPGSSGPIKGRDSAVDLAKKLDDDELVLGGSSGTGSDITLGGDSGISLVDPADSGLSLEQPLDLGAGEESLELGEDDMLQTIENSGVGVKGDDEFLLTPTEESLDAEDSESGSQVIALDTEGDEAATMIGGMPGGVSAMLEEDYGAAAGAVQPGIGALGAPLGAGGQAMAMPGGMMMPIEAALPEAPYTGLNITALVFCTLLLILCGMFMYDLVRNIWSWDAAYTVNSSMMDTVLSWFE